MTAPFLPPPRIFLALCPTCGPVGQALTRVMANRVACPTGRRDHRVRAVPYAPILPRGR